MIIAKQKLVGIKEGISKAVKKKMIIKKKGKAYKVTICPLVNLWALILIFIVFVCTTGTFLILLN